MSCGSKRCEDLGCFGMCDSALTFGHSLSGPSERDRRRFDETGEEYEARVGRVRFSAPPPILDVHVWGVPNRLRGAWINSEGDAV